MLKRLLVTGTVVLLTAGTAFAQGTVPVPGRPDVPNLSPSTQVPGKATTSPCIGANCSCVGISCSNGSASPNLNSPALPSPGAPAGTSPVPPPPAPPIPIR